MPRYQLGKLFEPLALIDVPTPATEALTNQVLLARREPLILSQVVKEQLDISTEAVVRIARRKKAVNLHRAIVPKVQVELISSNRDPSNGLSRLGNGIYVSQAGEPCAESQPFPIGV